MQLKVLAQYNQAYGYLDVHAGFAGPEFDGQVVKAIQRRNKKEDLTVGLRADRRPVYILIRNAQKMGRVFHEAAVCIGAGKEPGRKVTDAMAKRCLALMAEMAMAYQKKSLQEVLDPKVVEPAFEFSCAS